MQGEPDGAVAVLGQFDEVVATTQGSQGKAPVPVVLVGRRAGLFGQDLEYVNAFGGRGGELRVVLAGAHGDTPLDARADSRRRGNISALEGRPHSNHAAADVDADGCRDHGALGRKNGPDRRALSVVAVGHDGDVLEHERHRSRVEDLLLRRRLDRVPREEDNCLVVDRFHGIETSGRQAGRSRDAETVTIRWSRRQRPEDPSAQQSSRPNGCRIACLVRCRRHGSHHTDPPPQGRRQSVSSSRFETAGAKPLY